MEKMLFRKIIESYISAYNQFDVEGMLLDMDEDVKFENISGGVPTLTTYGIDQLRSHADEAIKLFKSRTQKITGINYKGQDVKVGIDYQAILAVDLPGGLKAGDEIKLKGITTFKFRNDKIIEIIDES